MKSRLSRLVLGDSSGRFDKYCRCLAVESVLLHRCLALPRDSGARKPSSAKTIRKFINTMAISRVCEPSWWFLCVKLLVLSAMIIIPGVHASGTKPSSRHDCPNAIFNFGDSLTDTGSVVNAFPYDTDAENSPYGEKFFGTPAKRFCNGRVVPDFFSLAFSIPLLDPYFQTGSYDYRHGANFAVGGATASNSTVTVPFVLPLQVSQFVRFKRSALSVDSQKSCGPFRRYVPKEATFGNALYTLEFGGNDIFQSLLELNRTAAEIINQVIPDAMKNYAAALQTLYKNNARRFLLFSVPNAGCSTLAVTLFVGFPVDELGCIIAVNRLAQGFNVALDKLVQTLRPTLPGACISIFNYYDASMHILKNLAKYGFDPSKPFTACCGAPGVGPYNYNPSMTCGHINATRCSNPDEYINWDGVHFTDSFYSVIADFALNGEFTDVPTNYTSKCGLSFSLFGNSVTYDQIFGGKCNVGFV